MEMKTINEARAAAVLEELNALHSMGVITSEELNLTSNRVKGANLSEYREMRLSDLADLMIELTRALG